MLRISARDLPVDGADARGRVVGREDVAAGLAGERLERRVARRCRSRSRRRSTPAFLAAVTAAASLVLDVSSPSVRTTSTFVSVGAVASSLAGLDHGVVERGALHGVQRHLVHRGGERVRVGVERVHGVGLVPERVDRRSSRPCAWPSRTRRLRTWRRPAGRPAIERLTSIASRWRLRSRRPTASTVTGLPLSCGDQIDAAQLVAARGDHDRGDERIARRVDLRDPDGVA